MGLLCERASCGQHHIALGEVGTPPQRADQQAYGRSGTLPICNRPCGGTSAAGLPSWHLEANAGLRQVCSLHRITEHIGQSVTLGGTVYHQKLLRCLQQASLGRGPPRMHHRGRSRMGIQKCKPLRPRRKARLCNGGRRGARSHRLSQRRRPSRTCHSCSRQRRLRLQLASSV